MTQRFQSWWVARSPIEKHHTQMLALIVAAFLVHFVAYSAFYIEDAAITFSYSRNFAEGAGFVTYGGGERVEGYSNPSWTFLIAFFYLLKIPPFFAAKLLGAIFGALTLPFVYGIAKRCRPEAQDHIPLIPPLLLAGSSTYTIWAASGLENSLFNLFLAAGLYRVLVESEHPDSKPLSALCFFGLAITRPEGIVYAAIAGFFRLVMAIQKKRIWKPIGWWLACFWIPFVAYQMWRWNYFGWAWPNTYYAKLDGENRFKPFRFGSRGWLYSTNYFRAYWIAYLLPLYAIGLATLKDRRRYFVLAITLIGTLLICWNGKASGFIIPFSGDKLPEFWTPIQKHWDHGRVFFLLGSAFLLGFLTLFHKGAIPRLMVLTIGCAAVFFVVFSGGDWMKQWRWYSLVSVPNFILLGLGIGAFADAFPKKLSKWVATVLVVAVLLPNTWNTAYSAPEPETSVKDVRRRVVYMSSVQDRIHLDRVTLLDVDMGAHMWFTHTDELRSLGVIAPSWQIVDMAGLVDVPMARHIYQEAFMEQYVFEERNPTFAHVHGGWATKTRIPRLDLWETDYIPIPGYPSGSRSFHMGNHIRKDLIMEESHIENPSREVLFSQEVRLLDWDVPSPTVAAKGDVYIDVWLSAGMHGSDFRFYVMLKDDQGRQHMASLPPGYDWFPPSKWEQDEIFHGRFDFRLPEHIEEGSYDIGFMVIDSDTGEVLSPPPSDEDTLSPVAYFQDVLDVVSKEEAHTAAQDDYQQALTQAADQQCEEAAESWRQARYHVWRDTSWRAERHPNMMSALSLCHVHTAEKAENEAQKIAALLEAKLYDHQQPRLLTISKPLAQDLAQRGQEILLQAEELFERGQRLKNFFGGLGDDFLESKAAETLAEDLLEEDFERQARERAKEAYPLLRDAMRMDPTLSSVRRSAERARDLTLNIQAKERDSARRKREREEAKERRQRKRAKTKRARQELQRSPRLQEERPGEDASIEPPSIAPRLPPGMGPAPSRRQLKPNDQDSIRLPIGNPRPAPTQSRPSPSID